MLFVIFAFSFKLFIFQYPVDLFKKNVTGSEVVVEEHGLTLKVSKVTMLRKLGTCMLSGGTIKPSLK